VSEKAVKKAEAAVEEEENGKASRLAGISSAAGIAANTMANVATAVQTHTMNRKLDSIEARIVEGNLAVVGAIEALQGSVEALRGDLAGGRSGSRKGSRRSGSRKSSRKGARSRGGDSRESSRKGGRRSTRRPGKREKR